MGNSHHKCVYWAALEGRANDLVYHLSHADAEALSVPSTEKRWTPIHAAAGRGHQQCLRILWEAGSKLNIPDKDGYTPLHLATLNQHVYCARLLLQIGASIAPETKFEVTPLHVAASVGSTPLVEEIVQQGGFINCQESWGQTPLIIATSKSRYYTMGVLLRLGADPEIRDYHHGYTALHVACNSRDEANVLVLLDAGVNIQSTDGQGLTPMGLALCNKFYRVVPLFLEYGSKLSEGDRQVLPQHLLDYIDKRTENPLSLQQISRINLRRTLGPLGIDQLPHLELDPEFVTYVQSILNICDGKEIKQVSIEAQAFLHPAHKKDHCDLKPIEIK